MEEKLRNCTKKCDNDPSRDEMLKIWNAYRENTGIITLLKELLFVLVQRGTWYVKAEKKNKYFLNLEKSNKNKSCLRKILKSDGTIAVVPKTIMSELEFFYSSLYKEYNSHSSSFLEDLGSSYLDWRVANGMWRKDRI